MKKYFILKLDSYESDGSSLTVDAGGAGGTFTCTGSYAVLILYGIKRTENSNMMFL